MGARGAVRAAVMAAEAAAAKPAPAGSGRGPAENAPRAAASQGSDRAYQAAAGVKQAAAKVGEASAKIDQTRAGVARGSKRFGEAVWRPFVQLSGVLWLEVMGVFFGLFVLTAGMNVWKLRGNLHDAGANHTEHQHLLFSIAMLAVFGYFCVSSFVRAARRERGRS